MAHAHRVFHKWTILFGDYYSEFVYTNTKKNGDLGRSYFRFINYIFSFILNDVLHIIMTPHTSTVITTAKFNKLPTIVEITEILLEHQSKFETTRHTPCTYVVFFRIYVQPCTPRNHLTWPNVPQFRDFFVKQRKHQSKNLMIHRGKIQFFFLTSCQDHNYSEKNSWGQNNVSFIPIQPEFWGCVAGMSRFYPIRHVFFFILKNFPPIFCFKRQFSPIFWDCALCGQGVCRWFVSRL